MVRRTTAGAAVVLAAFLLLFTQASAAYALPGTRIVSINGGRCLSVPGATNNPAEGLIIWDCDGYPDQNWYIKYERRSGGGIPYYSIRRADNGYCVSVDAARKDWGARVTQYPCGSPRLYPDQYWNYRYIAQKGGHQFVNENSGLCMGVAGGNPNNLGEVIQWPCGDWADHHWAFY
ncbi:RICIN domain-containing protein [Streptomyces sp. NPDC051907]|uniref:RICIN domain-containing protein n=1 Tax=Streptomyces sp. NPDC051907 TaxID=3155284 RepID=UPI003449A6CF